MCTLVCNGSQYSHDIFKHLNQCIKIVGQDVVRIQTTIDKFTKILAQLNDKTELLDQPINKLNEW